MYQKIRQLLKAKGVKRSLEIALIIVVFLSVKAYMQRDLLHGTAPAIEGVLLNDQTVALHSYTGKPLLLHFWATWCGVCKLEQGSIESISKTHNVITVAMNSGNAADIQNFMAENALSFPVVVDEFGSIAKRFGVSAVPTSFVLDSNGQIKFSEMGYTTGWGLRFRLWLTD